MFPLLRAMACFTFAFLATFLIAQNSPRFQFTEKLGPYPVGLKVVHQYDYSRTWHSETDELGLPYTGECARPLQTLIWYPAQETSGPTMTVRDYTLLRATETDFTQKANPTEISQNDEGRKEAFGDHLWAVRDAQPAAGHFPLVIYAPSFSAVSWENADLCEYLASRGYVVLASPDMGETSRAMTLDLAGAEAQARDISFLITYALTLPDVDMSEIAVGGFSWGGISNIFAASRDSRIKALFALDGSLRYYPDLLKQSGYVRSEQMKVPLLFFTQGDFALEEPKLADFSPGHSALNAWTHGDLITVRMLGLTHPEFSSAFQRDENIWKQIAPMMKADYTRADGIAGYAWTARYASHFLDAYLKHDAAAMEWLKKSAVENGAPPHFVVANYRAATGTPATLDSFREELHRKGFDHAAEIYAKFQKQDPSFKLSEDFINTWGYDLMSAHHLPEATEIFKLNVSLYPDSWNVYDSLAEAYMNAGDKQRSIEFYKKSLERNPSNDNAREKLKEAEQAVARPPAPSGH
jgi:dienelactone hydrolase